MSPSDLVDAILFESDLTDALGWHEGGQALAQLHAGDDDVSGAVGPGPSQLEGATAVGEYLQAAIGDRWPAQVTQDALALFAAVIGDRNGGVEGEAAVQTPTGPCDPGCGDSGH